ncbi:MAG TPA: glycosyltransferase family 2 protein [Polyangia bacterium]|jgi:glycosyltransferase involved in cell wall biosynthesis|nr:glycosyltransferase family 2 protein [Polyangia bacterium]
MISVVIPVYRNSGNIAPLLAALAELGASLRKEKGDELEAVFVVDGSPDDSHARLLAAMPSFPVRAQLLSLSRNFGSFAAVRAGLEAARGDRFAVIAADLQEPPHLVVDFNERLAAGRCDVVVGARTKRADPLLTRLASSLYWKAYRRWVLPEIPRGGVDCFGCTRQVRDEILKLRENNSSLVGLLYWVGFQRELIEYERRRRTIGESAWTFAKKLRYLSDSVFNFTDLPIRMLFRIGFFGMLASTVASFLVLAARLTNRITVPGYTATVLMVVFFGALNCLGLGIIGGYAWRTLENTKQRPNYLVATHLTFDHRERES